MKASPSFMPTFSLLLLLVLSFSAANSQIIDSCNSKLNLNALLPFDPSSFNCKPVWSTYGFILRFMQTGASQWSFVLSAPTTNAYFAMGFSPSGQMVGSSAIVGWIGSDSVPRMKRYFLGGQTPNEVVPDQGNLQVGNSSIVSDSGRTYMAFQLNTDLPESKLIYSVGQFNQLPSGPAFTLSQHRDETRTVLNYATGQVQKTISTAGLKRSHGILNMVGWGILMPIGIIVARYMKQWDPLWFYSHTSIQSLGFVLGIAGIICGFILSNRVSTDVGSHRAIGITVLILGCLQVFAFLARPNKESKVRKYWNWYHYGIGRLAIFMAAVNVFYGISIAKAGSSWNAGFAVVIVILFIITLVLELRTCMTKNPSNLSTNP